MANDGWPHDAHSVVRCPVQGGVNWSEFDNFKMDAGISRKIDLYEYRRVQRGQV